MKEEVKKGDDVGGRTVELSETEFAIRGRGYIKSLSDLEQIVVKNDKGVPVLLKDVARVELAPDERRGITEMNGEGEVVSGIALQRFGENALSVIQHVKDRLAEIAPSLPQGVTHRRRSMTAPTSSIAPSIRSSGRCSRKASSSRSSASSSCCTPAARWSPSSRCRSAC